MGAIGRSLVKIWVVPADTHPSTLAYGTTTSLGYIPGEIKSYARSGGETELESDACFGGYVAKEVPSAEYEVSMEVIPSLSATSIADRWDGFIFGAKHSTGVYSSIATPGNKAIYIQAVDNVTTPTVYKHYAFNQCQIVTRDLTDNADDNLSMNITFKFTPTTSGGLANFVTVSTTTMITALPAWTSYTS